MNQDDFVEFISAVDFTLRVIRKPPIEDNEVLKAWFMVLSKYSLQQVKDALSVSATHPQSRYGLDPALIVECMGITEEREITWQMVVEAGRKPKTPMGVLVRIHAIKSFEYRNSPNHYLQAQAMAFLDDLPEHKARALRGEYTRSEITVMIDKGVAPNAPFYKGMPEYTPLEGMSDPMRLTYREALDSPVHKENVARAKSREQNGIDNPAGRLKVQAELAKLFEDVEEKIEYTGAEAEKILINDLGEE